MNRAGAASSIHTTVQVKVVVMSRCLAALVLVPLLAAAPARADDLAALSREFESWTGAALVFDRAELPTGRWFEQMPALAAKDRERAARILVVEARHYPKGWLATIGLRSVGVFAGLASDRGDGFRPWDDELGGYRYFGLWNGADAVAAAYYTDGQLPLTFHHEVFHHQPTNGDAAIDGFDQASGFQSLEQHHCAGHGEAQAKHQCHAQTPAPHMSQAHAHDDGDQDLHNGTRDGDPADGHQIRQ